MYDVIVVGAGHAGIEASLASARMGCSTLLITFSRDSIGALSCNPAVGGVGKGQLVKEIDALGGEMAAATDACGIQFRMLNASRGAAVRSSRAQVDRFQYASYMRNALEAQDSLAIREAEVKGLDIEEGVVRAVVTGQGEHIAGRSVVLCPGTFLDGLIHIGLQSFPGGRLNERAAAGLSSDLTNAGFKLLRFKTGTCPRLDKDSIDLSRLSLQNGDEPPQPFSFSTRLLTQPQVACAVTYTNQKTHEIIRANLDRSPLYTGVIKATGVRYCPSIEDKVMKFAERQRHQIFLEPEGLGVKEIYPNGLATSLPEDAQLLMLHSIEGLQHARVIRYGYGIEHTVIDARQLYPTLESKPVQNLFLAGQINGTTGYEEAAAQGLVAGINASLRSKGEEPFILDRASGYIGVLIDDLTTKGTNEPYRMFTSRVEYRLILREDNADLRLRGLGFKLGLVNREKYAASEAKREALEAGIRYLKATRVKPSVKVNDFLSRLGSAPLEKAATLEELLKRPEVTLAELKALDHIGQEVPEAVLSHVETEVKYSGYIRRQAAEVERFKNLERIGLPSNLAYTQVPGLSREIKEKLAAFRPLNLGQASRISGVTPAAVLLLMVYIRKFSAQK